MAETLTRMRRFEEAEAYLDQAKYWAWTGVPFVYLVNPTGQSTGPYATIAVLGALAARRQTGHGQYIDMALLDCQVAVLANQAMNYLCTGAAPVRLGNAPPNIVPYQAFASADGLQLTGKAEAWSHHFSNVLFNNMRGGVFLRNHDVPMADFADFLGVRNATVARCQRAKLAEPLDGRLFFAGEAVSIPVMAANLIRTPAQAEAQLEEGVQDFVCLGRGHVQGDDGIARDFHILR